MITRKLRVGAFLCVLAAGVGCGSTDNGADNEFSTPTGMVQQPTAGARSTTTTPPQGAAGKMAVTPSTMTTAPSSGTAGAGGAAPAASSSNTTTTTTTMMTDTGAAGSSAAADGSGGASAGDAGADAAAGAGGDDATATAGAAAPPGSYIRGPDPTMATAIGTAKGPYPVKSYTDGFKKGTMYLAGTIYYPDGGDAVPPFGCVIVVPGFTAYQSSIMNWGPFLASNGIVTMTIDTLTTGDQPDQRAGELLDALNDCVNENEREGSPLKGKIDKNTTGLMGWSMGGGGTLIAASQTPSLKAAIGLCAWGPHGGEMDKVPVLMFEGTADVLAASMSDGYYQAVPDSVPKMLFETAGADHFYANDPASQMGIVGLYGLSWMKVFLEGDMRYKKFLTAEKPSITTNKFATNVK